MRNCRRSVQVTLRLVIVFATLILISPGCRKSEAPSSSALLCYVGGTMRPAMERLIEMYEQQTGKRVDLDYGDSGSNFTRIKTQHEGDLYVAHDPFLAPLENEGLCDQAWTLAVLTPVIIVPEGNPKGIVGLGDLAEPEMKIGLTDPMYSTLGYICPVMFEKTGLAEQIQNNVATRMKMGGELANAVGLGRFDAGLVWNAVAHLRQDKLDVVPIAPEHRPDPEVDAVSSATFGEINMARIKVFIATLTCSNQLKEARAFAEFCASEKGREVFAELGFTPVD